MNLMSRTFWSHIEYPEPVFYFKSEFSNDITVKTIFYTILYSGHTRQATMIDICIYINVYIFFIRKLKNNAESRCIILLVI